MSDLVGGRSKSSGEIDLARPFKAPASASVALFITVEGQVWPTETGPDARSGRERTGREIHLPSPVVLFWGRFSIPPL